jgi:hypothetical protein
MYILNYGGLVAGQKQERLIIHVTHMYGQVTVDVDNEAPAGISPEQLGHMVQVIVRRLQDKVVPGVEHIVEEDGVHIGGESVHAKRDLPLLADGRLSAHVDCEIVADVSDRAKAGIDHVIEDELMKPMRNLVTLLRNQTSTRQRRGDIAAEAKLIKAVRGLMGGGLSGRGG